MADLESVLATADSNLGRLSELVRVKSISTDPAYAADCRKAAEWLVAMLTDIGFDVSMRDTQGHPMVTGHHDGPEGAPHVLFYGHYDVQPVDPLELWTSDPFQSEIREIEPRRRFLTGRGTSDDKGLADDFRRGLPRLQGNRRRPAVPGQYPVRKLGGIGIEIIETVPRSASRRTEEGHGDGLRHRNVGRRDARHLVSLRGLTGEEVMVKASNRDLHSGHFGGTAANPIHILAKILGDLHDETGGSPFRIFMTRNRNAGRHQGNVGRARPTAEVNGITGGYTGEGFKTVIPAQASAKVSFRLVGDQDPHAVRAIFRDFVRARIPADCSVEFAEHGTSGALHLPYASSALAEASAALEAEWGKPAAIVGMGGSIPIVGDFQSKLGMDSLLVGFVLEDDCIHSPNEKYDLRFFHKGTRSWVRILNALAG